jgi:hypothetical protein
MDEKHPKSYAWVFVAGCILGTLWVEYSMIHNQSYPDWSSSIVAIQTYVVITCLTMLVYGLLFRRKLSDVVAVIMIYVVFIAIPTGAVLAVRDGYDLHTQLLDVGWLSVHDFFYVVMVCQAVLTWILFVGLTKSESRNVPHTEQIDGGSRSIEEEMEYEGE